MSRRRLLVQRAVTGRSFGSVRFVAGPGPDMKKAIWGRCRIPAPSELTGSAASVCPIHPALTGEATDGDLPATFRPLS
jgi:hypothetical protein